MRVFYKQEKKSISLFSIAGCGFDMNINREKQTVERKGKGIESDDSSHGLRQWVLIVMCILIKPDAILFRLAHGGQKVMRIKQRHLEHLSANECSYLCRYTAGSIDCTMFIRKSYRQ